MKPFTFYDIYYTPFKELDDKHAGKFFRMICDFLDGKQVTIDAERDKEISPEFELYWESILSDLETYRKSAGKSCGLDKRSAAVWTETGRLSSRAISKYGTYRSSSRASLE